MSVCVCRKQTLQNMDTIFMHKWLREEFIIMNLQFGPVKLYRTFFLWSFFMNVDQYRKNIQGISKFFFSDSFFQPTHFESCHIVYGVYGGHCSFDISLPQTWVPSIKYVRCVYTRSLTPNPVCRPFCMEKNPKSRHPLKAYVTRLRVSIVVFHCKS